MSELKKCCYKYCIVPDCSSTTIRTPKKIFFFVPMQKDKREKWCKVMKRGLIGPKSIKYVCEDHFDLEKDTENFVKYKLVGGRLKLKTDVCPHKFNYQNLVKPVLERGVAAENLLKNDVPSTSSDQHFEVIDCDSIASYENVSIPEDPLSGDCTVHIPDNRKKCKRVQINIKVTQKDKQVQTIVKRRKMHDIENKRTDTMPESPSSSPSRLSISSLSSESSVSTALNTIKPEYCEDTITKISTNVGFYLGLPKDIYFLIKVLSESVASPIKHILISLKKIRLNDSNIRLGIDFELSKCSISKIFSETIPLIANRMKQLIFFPPVEKIYEKLPISFRKRYSKTASILDCFEIRIEKPTSAMKQALTWSEYKHCNTIKYLISITPDGLINFVSDGYGGRASDTTIFEDCDFLQNLTPGCSIMADRGFKNISYLLEAKGCHLIRPPSVTSGKACSKLEVMETKRIAALRINVERTIGRLRNFSMVAPHACVDTKLIYLLDFVVVIASGIVNVQNKLIKM